MAKPVIRLTDAKCTAARPLEKIYKLSDGEGLYLEVKPTGTKTWRFNFKRANGKNALATFGGYPAVSLKMARARRDDAKEQLANGKDPVDEARKEKLMLAGELDQTFERVARQWLDAHKADWVPMHAHTIQRRLELHLFPLLGSRPISELTPRDLYRPLLAVEAKGSFDLANRLRNYLDNIMRLAIRHGYLESNPARDLTRPPKAPKTEHRAALELSRLPEFMTRLEAARGRRLYRIALKLSVLLFVRASELRLARWDEIDLDAALWTIPPARQLIDGVKYSERGAKMREAHKVPLSEQAVALFREAYEMTGTGSIVFTGDHDKRKPMSEAVINMSLRRMGYDTKTEVTAHGFRAMACSALNESGLFSVDAVERQMSHKDRGVRAAYTHKADYMQERRLMMQWWANYLDANKADHITPRDFAGLDAVNVVALGVRA
tara:strand:+ start:178 stop:1485 length:1308 start_codon:yes stop_codon:yes gene_type:complete